MWWNLGEMLALVTILEFVIHPKPVGKWFGSDIISYATVQDLKKILDVYVLMNIIANFIPF